MYGLEKFWAFHHYTGLPEGSGLDINPKVWPLPPAVLVPWPAVVVPLYQPELMQSTCSLMVSITFGQLRPYSAAHWIHGSRPDQAELGYLQSV